MSLVKEKGKMKGKSDKKKALIIIVSWAIKRKWPRGENGRGVWGGVGRTFTRAVSTGIRNKRRGTERRGDNTKSLNRKKGTYGKKYQKKEKRFEIKM